MIAEPWVAVFVGAIVLIATFTAGVWCGRHWGSTPAERAYQRLVEATNGR